ncbi:unnamed protein product [Urochloa humidicola]
MGLLKAMMLVSLFLSWPRHILKDRGSTLLCCGQDAETPTKHLFVTGKWQGYISHGELYSSATVSLFNVV